MTVAIRDINTFENGQDVLSHALAVRNRLRSGGAKRVNVSAALMKNGKAAGSPADFAKPASQGLTRLAKKVAEKHDLLLQELKSGNQKRAYTCARHEFSYLAIRYSGKRVEDIALFINQTMNSVRHGAETHAKRHNLPPAKSNVI